MEVGGGLSLNIWDGITEHPSDCDAGRVTIISPRGEMGQVRSALGPEGCSVVSANT